MKRYHSKEKIVEIYTKEEYRQKQSEIKALKKELEYLRFQYNELCKELSKSFLDEIENLRKINDLRHEIDMLKYEQMLGKEAFEKLILKREENVCNL